MSTNLSDPLLARRLHIFDFAVVLYVVTCPLELFRCLKFGAIKGNKETAYGTLEKIPRDFRANEGGYELTPLRSYEWFFLSVCSLQRAKFQPSCDLIFLNMIFNGLKISRGRARARKKRAKKCSQRVSKVLIF